VSRFFVAQFEDLIALVALKDFNIFVILKALILAIALA
jgi:hypothetical protein